MQNPRQAKYNVGDIVRLKSGSPLLTVVDVINDYKYYGPDGRPLSGPFISIDRIHTKVASFSGKYEVQWFGDSNTIQEAIFVEEVLSKQ